MKVLILITKSNWGGAQRYVYDLATNLPKDVYDVEVMAGGNGLLIERLQEAGIKSSGDLPIFRNVNIISDIKVFFKLINILKEKRPDVLHINSSKIGGLGALAGRIARVPNIVFTAHGWAFNENRTLVSKLIVKTLHWITIILSHSTIAVSEALQAQMINWPYIMKRITVINNGIKSEPIFSKANARLELSRMNPVFAEILKTNKSLTIVGSVGELHHIKGYDFALKSMKEIVEHDSNQKILYVIFGTGEEKEHLEKLIVDYKLEKSVILFGYVNQASHYLKAFDIFLLPSLSEGFPYIALEAGLASLPIVASAVGGIPEIIEDMKSGVLIQPRKSREIRHALEFYMSHKRMQKEYGLAIYNKVAKEITIENMISKTKEVYSHS